VGLQLVTGSRIVIRGYDDHGFNVNGVRMRGSILCFQSLCLLWDVQGVAGVTAASLSPGHLLKPRSSECTPVRLGCVCVRHVFVCRQEWPPSRA
jgi:hypothetical protein